MTTYTVTFEETKFLPVRQYEAKTLDSLMYFIQAEKMMAEYDLTVTLSKIERDDEMPIKVEIVDFVEFVIRKDKSAYEAEISKWKGVAEYRNKQIEQMEQQIRELKGELYAGKEQIRQLKETNEHLVPKYSIVDCGDTHCVCAVDTNNLLVIGEYETKAEAKQRLEELKNEP